MKKSLLALGAVVLAVVFSAFTTKSLTTVYFVYDGSGDQKALANYMDPAPTSEPDEVAGSTTLAWFIGEAADPDNVQVGELSASFEEIDGDFGGTDNNSLNDETEDHISLEKR